MTGEPAYDGRSDFVHAGQTGTATLSEAPIIASNALIYPIDNPILLVSPSGQE